MSSGRQRVRSPSHAAIATLAIALTVAACSKGEPETSTKPRPNVPLQESKPAAPAPSQAESGEGLRERLARQEAASKMFDKTPAPPAKPDVEKKSAPAKVEPPKPEPPKPEPAKPVAKAPEPPKPEPVKVEPPKAEPPKVEVAKAEPPKPAPPPPPVTRLVTRVDPEFPREAVQSGATTGTVKARLTLDAAGNVTHVEVTDATPRRIFDRAVVRALSQWKYNEGAPARSVEVEIAFKQQ
jgi:TonB family protein